MRRFALRRALLAVDELDPIWFYASKHDEAAADRTIDRIAALIS